MTTILPKKHTIGVDEIHKVTEAGLKLIGLGNQPEVLLNRHFPNFNLLAFYSEISEVLTPLCIGLKNAELVFNSSPHIEMDLRLYTDNVRDETLGLGFSRIFSLKNNELSVEHAFFRLPEIHRGSGVAKKIIKLCLQQYINMGVQKIRIHAALSVGGYAWALYFFTVPNKKEIDIILEKSRRLLQPSEFIIVNRIYNNYYNNNQKADAFPIVKWAEIPFMKKILQGSEWNGIIDFNNQEQINNFILYVTV